MQFEEVRKLILNKLRDDLPLHYIYHNIEHTLDVQQAAENIGRGENISSYEMRLLATAALFHDAGFLKCAKGHEAESCGMAKAILPGYQYNANDIEQICGMIMATQLPQSPHNLLEQILADADLDYLGREDFFTIGDKLYQEFCLSKTINDRNEWNKLQIDFIKEHTYFTKTAINLRQAKKEANICLLMAQSKNDETE